MPSQKCLLMLLSALVVQGSLPAFATLERDLHPSNVAVSTGMAPDAGLSGVSVPHELPGATRDRDDSERPTLALGAVMPGAAQDASGRTCRFAAHRLGWVDPPNYNYSSAFVARSQNRSAESLSTWGTQVGTRLLQRSEAYGNGAAASAGAKRTTKFGATYAWTSTDSDGEFRVDLKLRWRLAGGHGEAQATNYPSPCAGGPLAFIACLVLGDVAYSATAVVSAPAIGRGLSRADGSEHGRENGLVGFTDTEVTAGFIPFVPSSRRNAYNSSGALVSEWSQILVKKNEGHGAWLTLATTALADAPLGRAEAEADFEVGDYGLEILGLDVTLPEGKKWGNC
jgi:hypothetical protein